jgi:CheY-like chemotaxis protein
MTHDFSKAAVTHTQLQSPSVHSYSHAPAPAQIVVSRESTPLLVASELIDDRQNIQPGDRVLLIIEDDVKFGRILLDLAHDRGFKAVVSASGSGALPLVRRFNPSVITLDINLPDMDGWRLLDILKRSAETRHIPIHIISVDDPRERGLQMGAFSVLEKPVDHATLQQALARSEEFIARKVKELLLVEDDDLQSREILKLIGNGDVHVTRVTTGREALQALQNTHFDCVVLDLVLPDMDGVQLIETIRRDTSRRLPVIIHTAKDLYPADESKLRNLVESFILKGPESPQQLFDETALFLHRFVETMSDDRRLIIEKARRREPGLAGRKVLIVDDDIRNIFSLTGVLEQHDIEVLNAESGREGIAMLNEIPDVDMVLMDVMMPDMDGYETMRQIRRSERFRKLPMIAITAKAMKGDREKCIEAGASEYMSKPVDVDQLVSMMRVWLRRV